MAEVNVLDRVGSVEFVAEMLSLFGVRRATELFGFAILMGATGKEMPSEVVEALRKMGISKSAVYRALADYRKFVRHLEHKHGLTIPMQQVFSEIAAAASSPMGESVVN